MGLVVVVAHCQSSIAAVEADAMDSLKQIR